MKRKLFARLACLPKERKLISLLLVLPAPIIFMLCWFSMWLHLIIFIGGYTGLFLLASEMEKLRKENKENGR